MDKSKSIVEKRNVLNEMRETKMSLQELRFFSVFLANIDPRNEDTRMQEFTVSEFAKIMDIKVPKAAYVEQVCDGLMSKILTARLPYGGWEKVHLFNKCSCKKKEKDGQWFIRFEVHSEMMPFLFGYKREYFRYNLWNALNLKSANHVRMYELLKQYEKLGERTMTVKELRGYLGITDKEYKRFDRFREVILDGSRNALAERTDIGFDYVLHKTGRGGKVESITFTIFQNPGFEEKLNIKEFLSSQQLNENMIDISEFEEVAINPEDEKSIVFYSDACNDDFTPAETAVLRDLVCQLVDGEDGGFRRYQYLQRKYHEACAQSPQKKYLYLKKMLENETKK